MERFFQPVRSWAIGIGHASFVAARFGSVSGQSKEAMGPLIRNLLALQEVDLQVISLNSEKTKLLNWVAERKSEVERCQREFEEREAQLKRLKLDVKKSEIELAETSDRIRKLEAHQIHVKSNQEYKALDKEIYEAKVHKARTEDFLLEKMELLEQEDIGIRGARQQLGLQGTRLKEQTAGVEGEVRDIERRMSELHVLRSEMLSRIEDRFARLYGRIFNSKRGPVLVPVVNRACQGCHLAVPAAVESILRRDEAEVITCENCSRILYIPEEENSG